MTDLDPEAQAILAQARAARTPSADDRARVGARLSASLGVALASQASAQLASQASAQLASQASAQLASQASAQLASQASAQLASQASAAGAGASAGQAGAATGALAGTKALAGTTAGKWLLGLTLAGGLAAGGYAAQRASTDHRAQAPIPAAAHAATSREQNANPLAQAAPEDATSTPTPSTESEPAPVQRAQRATPHARRAFGDDLAAEAQLLHRARTAWQAREPTRALRLLAQHRTRYPRSALRWERDALRVLSLCDAGEAARAARLGRGLIARAPQSPWRAAIERSCAFAGDTP